MPNLNKLKQLCKDVINTPHMNLPRYFVGDSDLNKMLEISYASRTALPKLIEIVELQREALDRIGDYEKLDINPYKTAREALDKTDKLIEEM